MMEESRKVYGWLVRGRNAAAWCSSMWADTMRGEYYCGNLLWHSSLTLLSPVFECYAQSIDNTHISGLNVVNPSFLDPQSNAVFRIQVRPETIPSSKIQWSVVSGAATFPSGSAGTEVNVLGSSGMVDLEVRVLGTTDERMHFKSKVQ